MDKIMEKILEYNRIIIHGHCRPDGDCIGSQYGLYYLLKKSFPHKDIFITGESSEYVGFIGKPQMLDEKLFSGALSICLDCATSDRLSDKRFNLSSYSIKIDHHPDVEQYCDYNYVDTTCPACGQIITEFYLKYKDVLKMSKEAATALYVGISTDTGRFRFDSVTSRTFNAAGVLLDNGVDLSYVENNLSIETLDTLKLKGYCLSNFKMSENGFAYIVMTRDIINRFGVSDEEAANMVSCISTIDICPVWAIFMEYPNEIRIRLRSRGPVINGLAAEYAGGGHPKASGARLNSFDDLAGFVSKADQLVKDYKNK